MERQLQLTPFPRLPEIRLSIPELNVNCKTVSCINKQLTRLDERLSKQIDKLDALFDEFQQEVFECEQLVQLTQYFGYLYTPDGVNLFETTALDYTEAAGQPFTYFVVYTCPVA